MKIQFSAGGIVFKKIKDQKSNLKDEVFILVSQHSQHHGWVFPKGLIGDHVKEEGKEETALREVREETGVEGKITRALNPVTYWFVMEGEKIRKTVYYYLMEFTGGDIAEHDSEMENVEWLPAEKVEERLTYKSDKIVWQEARKLL